MDIEKKLAEHLRSELVKIRPAGKQITKFVLRHAAPGAKGNDVETFEHEEALSIDDIEVFASQIVQRAQTDADGLGSGAHRYNLQTIIGKGVAGGRFVFRMRASEDPDDEIAGEDSPSTRGLLSQLMRHNEAMARTLNAATQSIINVMARNVESANTRMAKMEEERSATFLALEAAKSEQHNRDLELMVSSQNEDRKTQAFNKAMALAPVIANRIMGSQVVPVKEDPLVMILNQLAESLDGKQIEAIANSLTMEQRIMFAEAIQAAKARSSNNAS